MARMLGRFTTGGCWSGDRSHGRPCITPGIDCAGWDRDTRKRKRAEDREVRDYISRLWAEDWDSPEDSAYDEK